MVTRENITGFVSVHPNREMIVAQCAPAETLLRVLPQQPDPIIVTMDLDAPENRVFPAELELIEQHLGDLLQEMLLLDEAKE